MDAPRARKSKNLVSRQSLTASVEEESAFAQLLSSQKSIYEGLTHEEGLEEPDSLYEAEDTRKVADPEDSFGLD
jgi:hypothetical protein